MPAWRLNVLHKNSTLALSSVFGHPDDKKVKGEDDDDPEHGKGMRKRSNVSRVQRWLHILHLVFFAEPVTKSWWMTTRRWGLLWVEKLRFATLRPHEGRLSAKAVAPASSGRWFFNVFPLAKTTCRMSCKAA